MNDVSFCVGELTVVRTIKRPTAVKKGYALGSKFQNIKNMP